MLHHPEWLRFSGVCVENMWVIRWFCGFVSAIVYCAGFIWRRDRSGNSVFTTVSVSIIMKSPASSG
jgi:hypothetical protein